MPCLQSVLTGHVGLKKRAAARHVGIDLRWRRLRSHSRSHSPFPRCFAHMPRREEPRTDTPPVRRFRDPGHVPKAGSLGELRRTIDALDEQIVGLLAERALCVRDATRFKRDPFQVAAPERQAAVFARVRELAAAQSAGFPSLPDVVEAAYRALVAGFVAGEGRFFDETEPIEP